MYTQYHLSITREALSERFSSTALKAVLMGNINQDNLAGQIGHPEYHFDDNAFEQGNRYLNQLRDDALHTIKAGGDALMAWKSFGKLTHAGQDFYAHSNYIDLWAEKNWNAGKSQFVAQDILLPELLNDPRLISGKSYNPWGLITILPWIGPIFAPLLPADSHARLNKDSPSRNKYFPLAYKAAVYRTIYEYNELIGQLTEMEKELFTGIVFQPPTKE
jgi:hypothetical protein